MYQLLIHQLKEKKRSTFWRKNIFINIFLGITAFYLLSIVVVSSLLADKILLTICKDCDVVEMFTGLLFYYFLFDIIARFMFQQIPTLSIQPYLVLPIKKRTLIHYPLIKSVFSFFNLMAILLIIPFFIKDIYFARSLQFSITWLISVLSLVAVNSFLSFYLKKYFSKEAVIVLLFISIVCLLLYLDIANIVSISEYFASGIYYLSNAIYLIFIPVLLAVSCYYFAYRLLQNNYYIEEPEKAAYKGDTSNFSFLENYGEIGQLIRLELKMILRNKRPRTLLYFSAVFVLYGLMFYRNDYMDDYFMLSAMGLLLTAMFSINYGQFLFSWESSYFDSFLTGRISTHNYIRSKHLFLSIACIIAFFLALPYALIDYKIAFINAAFLLYNIGISTSILMFFCTFNTSYIDLGKSQFMNYQGIGVNQYLIMIPIFGVPYLIYLLHLVLGILPYFYSTIAIIGLIGIVLNKYFLELIVNAFMKRKYKMATGFRQK